MVPDSVRGDRRSSPELRKRGRAWLYPDRKRCFACRGFFGFTILAGLWCSYECARHPEPSTRISDWPRQHRLSWKHQRAKRAFDSEAEAVGTGLGPGVDAYLCEYCLTWHIGTMRDWRIAWRAVNAMKSKGEKT